ncbi:MAG: trypsin-like peptidase domain-containing protein [Bacilli bacterium]|nr:trypsin-like peptidase domain-containing protein [Bacilli bacterium]
MTNRKVKDVEIVEKEEVKKEEVSPNRTALLYVIITILVCVIVVGCLYELCLRDLFTNKTLPSMQSIDNVLKKEKSNVTITETGLADAVEKVYDSVVIVENYSNGKLSSSGSGFAFKVSGEYGYILTNNHVINGSKDIKVTFTNEKTVSATVVGSDDYSDIAVLSVPSNSIVMIAETGSSENMRVGDTTFAVGAPLDSTIYSWTVTRGILSGKNRKIETSDSVMEVLQTDAAINSGNSGGPLCNINGEVIGITNMKIASSSIEGIGFAIPIETAMEVANSLISGEDIKRPYLGISIYEGMNRFSFDSSVYINSVEKGSSAEKAGLQAGDKLLKIGDTEITSVANFKYNLYKYKLGDKVKLTVERNGKTVTVTITLQSK